MLSAQPDGTLDNAPWIIKRYDGQANERTLYSNHLVLWPVRYSTRIPGQMPPIEMTPNRFSVLQQVA